MQIFGFVQVISIFPILACIKMSENDESELQVYHDALCRRINHLNKKIKDLRKLLNLFDVYGSTNANISNEITVLRRALRKVTLERDEVADEIRLRHIHAFKDGLADLCNLFEII